LFNESHSHEHACQIAGLHSAGEEPTPLSAAAECPQHHSRLAEWRSERLGGPWAVSSARPVLSLCSPRGEHKMLSFTPTQVANHPKRLAIEAFAGTNSGEDARLLEYCCPAPASVRHPTPKPCRRQSLELKSKRTAPRSCSATGV